MRIGHLIPAKRTSRVAWTLVGIAMALVTGAVANLFSAPRQFFGMALVSLDAAYFVVLAENWTSGRGIQTRGGMVDKRISPAVYFSIYLILTVAGLIALIVFLSALVLGG